MEVKKNPKSNLENYSKLFIQLGLVLALFVTYVAMENKTYDRVIDAFGDASMQDELEEDIPITERIEPVKPKAIQSRHLEIRNSLVENLLLICPGAALGNLAHSKIMPSG